MNYTEDEELACDISGRCQALAGDRDITNCIHCGKELHEKDGAWYTWDAHNHPDPKIQCLVVE